MEFGVISIGLRPVKRSSFTEATRNVAAAFATRNGGFAVGFIYFGQEVTGSIGCSVCEYFFFIFPCMLPRPVHVPCPSRTLKIPSLALVLLLLSLGRVCWFLLAS